jgi:hypothetical protein
VVVIAAGMTFVPARAHAQSSFIKDNVVQIIKKVGVHGNVSVRHPIDEDVTKGVSLGGSIGLAPGRTNGWKYPVGLTLFREQLHSPNGEEFAEVRTVALMAGIGYGWHFGKLSTGVQVQTGFALNHGRLTGDIPVAFGVADGSVAIDAHNSVLLRPQAKAEYFLSQKFSLRGSLDYMWIHPDIDVTTPIERFTDRWDLSNIHANIGVAFYPFRK